MWSVRFTALAIFAAASQSAISAEITAFLEPYRDIDVAAAEMGTIAALHVKEGDQVEKGQLLGQLDDGVLQASRKMAETAMQGRGKLHSAQAEFRLQQDRWQKLLGLRERQHASQQEVDRTQAQMEIAKANLETVHDELKLKGVEHERITAELRRRQFVSPIQGVVSVINKDEGEFVSTNDPIVAKVVQLDPLLAIMSVPMGLRQEIAMDAQVPLEVGGISGPVTGLVEFISPTADPQSGTIRVKLRIPNPQGAIACGAPCRWVIGERPSEPHLSPPQPSEPRLPTLDPIDHRREVSHRQDP